MDQRYNIHILCLCVYNVYDATILCLNESAGVLLFNRFDSCEVFQLSHQLPHGLISCKQRWTKEMEVNGRNLGRETQSRAI